MQGLLAPPNGTSQHVGSVVRELRSGYVISAAQLTARVRELQGPVPTYSPRRPNTCGTVRSRIFTSVHSDQLATYR